MNLLKMFPLRASERSLFEKRKKSEKDRQQLLLDVKAPPPSVKRVGRRPAQEWTQPEP